MKTLATYNIKGGVGKTAAAVNLGFLSSVQGAMTLVWDLDPQGAATFYFRIKAKVKGGAWRLIRRPKKLGSLIRGTDFDRLDLLPADFSNRNLDLFLKQAKKPAKRLARQIKPFNKSYDYVFLDCAPSISLVSESIFSAVDALLVPTIPTTLSLRTLAQLKKHLSTRGRKGPLVLPFLCMVDRRRALHRKICEQVAQDDDFLKTHIPYSSIVESMGDHRAPLATFAENSAPARAFETLWEEIKSRL